MSDVVMNGRVLLVPSNGQKRVAEEIATRLSLSDAAPPARFASGAKGHVWEQAVLPLRLRGRPLWSPSTSAPVLYRNQVVTVHDIGFVDVPQFYAPRFASTYRRIVSGFVGRVRHIATVSHFSAQRITEHYGIPAASVTPIYPGIAAGFRLRSDEDVAAMRKRFGLGDRPYLVAFSGADPRKNTAGILRAWAGLGASGKLVLYGRHSNTAVFRGAAAAPDPDGIVRVGGIGDDDLAALYSGASAMVFPSFYEGFGLPIVEAAASGAPVITSDRGAMREVAPASARLVDPDDTEALGNAMAAALAEHPMAADRRALAAETARYSWDAAADDYRRLFDHVFT
jgi:glycosyltransferase involved in cell wall biosynthesis